MQSGFFLGANSKDGFSSLYHTLSESAQKLYIIKASPGGGKSTFMKRVAELISAPCERIYCSSDPDSLDAVIFPTLGVAIADGTAPHILEPVLPLAREEYVNLSAFADPSKLQKDKIAQTTLRYKREFSRVYRLTGCAGVLAEDLRELACGGVENARIVKKAKGILAREVRPTGKTGREIPRFLSAISPFGYVTRFETVFEHAERVYEICDSYHLAAPLLFELCKQAVALGHTVYACYSPLCPDTLEHLILPDAQLAFVTSNADARYPYPTVRRIRLDAMMDREYRKSHRGKLKFAAEFGREMLDAACDELAQAKRIHDELEALYHPAIDFDGILDYAEKLAQKIRGF